MKIIPSLILQDEIIFNQMPPEGPGKIMVIPVPQQDHKVTISKSLKDRHDFLDVKGELSASILGGLITLKGSGEYLQETKSTVNSSSMSVIFRMQTVQKTVFLQLLQDCINFDVLTNGTTPATHVITSVVYGANGLVTAEYEYANHDHDRRIQGALQAKFEKLGKAFSIEGKVEADFKDKAIDEGTSFKYNWKCDGVKDDKSNIPITFEGAVERMQKFSQLLDGHGIPIRITLTPLSLVRQMFQINCQVHSIYKSLAQDTLTSIMNVSMLSILEITH